MSNDFTAASSLILSILNTLLFVIGALSVTMMMVGGLRYTVSNGDSNSITAAKNAILYAVIGLVVSIMSFALVNFVIKQLASGTSRTPKQSGPLLASWAPAAVVGLGVSSVTIAVVLLLRRSSRGLRWVAQYSAFWMPVDERVRRMSERWCLLRDTGFGLRLWFALSLLIASPITGWRCRRIRRREAFDVSAELESFA